MPYYRVWAKDDEDREEYWLTAEGPDDAKRLVALSCESESGKARRPAAFDCEPNEAKTPPPRLIYRRLEGPLTVKGR